MEYILNRYNIREYSENPSIFGIPNTENPQAVGCKQVASLCNSGVLSSAPKTRTQAPIGVSPIDSRFDQNGTLHLGTGESIPKTVKFGAFSEDFEIRAKEALAQMTQPHELQLLPFPQAAEIWLELHKDEIKERTYNDYRFYIRTLNKTFGPQAPGEKGMLLSQIHIGHILAYRKARQKTAGAWCINHEITTLKQIMEMAGLWDLIGKHYKPLRIENSGPPRVLTPEEEERFFRVIANPDKREWEVAYWAVSLTNNTSAYGCELRFLQLKHLFLDHNPPKIHIPDDRVKNDFRARVIPLNAVALKQVTRLLDRAQKLGATKPNHYLFPFRVKKGEYDVNRPASAFFIRSAFRSMRKATGLDWLQPRHFRNQIITKLFESGAPDETITSIAGHQAIKMSRYYSRIRIHAKAEALDKIAPKPEVVAKREKGASA